MSNATLEIQVAQGNRTFGYVCASDTMAHLITESCGCKPSKWDGCKGSEVASQVWEGMVDILSENGIDPAYEKGEITDTYDFLNSLFNLCNGHPEATVEVRY